MMWLVLYFIISIIIARYLDKKMRVATVFHSIMFIIITCYLLLLSNTSFIVNAFEHLLGEDTYNTFKGALYKYNTYYSSQLWNTSRTSSKSSRLSINLCIFAPASSSSDT